MGFRNHIEISLLSHKGSFHKATHFIEHREGSLKLAKSWKTSDFPKEIVFCLLIGAMLQSN